MSDSNNSDFQAAFDAGTNRPQLVAREEAGEAIAIIPGGMKAIDLAQFSDNPRRVQQSVSFQCLQSMFEYVEAQIGGSEAKPIIMVDGESKRVDAVINGWTETAPTHGDHIAYYAAKRSPDFLLWLTIVGTKYTQDDFCKMLKRQRRVVTSPGGAELLELVENLRLSSNATITSTGSNGRVTAMSFDRQVTAKSRQSAHGEVLIPQSIKIEVSPIEGSTPVPIELDMDVTINDSNQAIFELSWTDDPDRIVRAKFDQIVQSASEEADMKTYRGRFEP